MAAGRGRGVEGRAVNDAVEREGVIKGVIECVRYRSGIPGGVRYLRVFFFRRVSQRGFRYGGGRTALCDNMLQDHIWEGGGAWRCLCRRMHVGKIDVRSQWYPY